jgi:hypothetical protein
MGLSRFIKKTGLQPGGYVRLAWGPKPTTIFAEALPLEREGAAGGATPPAGPPPQQQQQQRGRLVIVELLDQPPV